MVTQCPYCAYDLVVSQGTAGKPVIRACLRWATTCPYCQQATIARAPPKGVLRRKEITPCRHCAQPLIVERREEGRLVLRAHRSVLKGGVL